MPHLRRGSTTLLLAVLDEGSHILKEYLEHRVEKAASAEQKIRSWIEGMLAQVVNKEAAHATRPFALSRARLSELFPEEVMNSEKQITAILREVIQQAIQSGDLPDADADRDSEIIHNMVLGWIERKLSGATPPNQADVDHLTEFVIFGLKQEKNIMERDLRESIVIHLMQET